MRTFILGLGAQKSGTTWLFKQLIKSPRHAGGLCKEYHLFDALHLGRAEEWIQGVRRRVENYPLPNGDHFVDQGAALMMSFYEDPQAYFDYFDSILESENSFSLDITPSYAALEQNVLCDIREQFLRRGISVKVVFLMREPVTRLESAVKMKMKRNKTLEQASSVELAAEMHKLINSKFNKSRSNYAATCQHIDAAFPQSEVFYGFYETLFAPSEIDRLSRFLGLPRDLFNMDQVVNRTGRHFKYSARDVAAFRECVGDRYEFVSQRFGFDLSHWDQALDHLIDQGLS